MFKCFAFSEIFLKITNSMWGLHLSKLIFLTTLPMMCVMSILSYHFVTILPTWCMFGENYCYCFVKEQLVLHSFKWCSAKSHEWMKFCTYKILCATLQPSDISIPAIMNEQPHKWWCLSSFCRHSRNLCIHGKESDVVPDQRWL